jgi:NitT/TauT family transport system substrate-binding protein
MSFKVASVIAGAIAGTMLMASCAAAPAADPSGTTAADAPTISFLYSPYADYAPFFLAEDKGYFDDAGIDVELIPKGGTSGETYQLVSTGNVIAGGATWGAGLFNATEAGASLDVIASVSRIPDSGPDPSPFMASTKSGVKEVADLKGKSVGIPGDGGFGIYSVYLALKQAGLSLDDVNLVNVGPPEIGPAMENGSIQAAWTIEPISSALRSQDIAVDIADVSHHAGTELGALVFNSDYAEKHPDAVVAFTAAYLKAAQELKDGGWKDAANKEIIAKYTELPVETLNSIALTVQDPTGEINWEDVRKQEQFFRDRGSLEYEGQSDIEGIFRSDLLKKAQEKNA